MKRYRIFFPQCREGQEHDDFLFSTDDLIVASTWAAMGDCFIVTDSHKPSVYIS